MRTDSVRIADEAQKAAADFIENRFGKDYLAPAASGISRPSPTLRTPTKPSGPST